MVFVCTKEFSMQDNLNKNISRLIGIVVILFLCYFILPRSLFVICIILYIIYASIIYSDVKNKPSNKQPNESPLPPLAWWQKVKADKDNWLDIYCKGCESPAEEAFLRSMVAEFNLKPQFGKLVSPGLVLEMQVSCGHYRFDFVANGRQIIEIDGAAWHSSPEQIERDRARDAYSVKQGFMVLRISAKTVFNTPNLAIEQVKKALEKTPNYTKPVSREVVTQPSLKNLSFSGLLNDVNHYVHCQSIKQEALSTFHLAIEKEKVLLETLVSEIEREIRVESMEPQERELYESARSRIESLLKNDGKFNFHSTEVYQWEKIIKPSPVKDPKIQVQIEREYERVMDERNRRLAQLSQRCAAELIFSIKFRSKLKEYHYPTINDIFK